MFKRWCSLGILLVILIPTIIGRGILEVPAIRSDGVGYHIWTHAILRGELHFRWFEDTQWWALNLTDPERHVYQNKYPPGVALVRLPVMAWLVDLDTPAYPFSDAENWACLILAGLALLAIAWIVLLTCQRLGVSWWASNLAVLLITFGTGLFHYATFDSAFSHTYTALGVAFLTWVLVYTLQDRKGSLPGLPVIALVTILILIRNTNVFFIGVWALALFVAGIRLGHRDVRLWVSNAVPVGLGVGIGVAIQLALNSYATGHLTLNSYSSNEEGFLWHRPMWLSVLCSYERGVVTYYPILAIVVAAGLWVRQTRLATLGLVAIMMIYAVLYGFWHSWPLGAGFGHRGYVDFAPFAIVIFAFALDRLSRGPLIATLILSGFAVYVSLCVMGGYWSATYPWEGARAKEYWDCLFWRPVAR